MKWKLAFWILLGLSLAAITILLVSNDEFGITGESLSEKILTKKKSAKIFSYDDVQDLLKAFSSSYSQQIDKRVADSLRESYLRRPKNKILAVDSAGNQQLMYKFVFRATDIQTILSNPTPPKIFVAKFGLDFPGNGGGVPKWHLIIFGSDAVPKGKDAVAITSIFENTTDDPATYVTDGQTATKAKNYISTYTDDGVNEGYRLKTTYTEQGKSNMDLDGFAFDPSQIQSIIKGNPSQLVVDEAVFYIGKRDVKGGNKISWHMIVYGSNMGTLLDFSTTLDPSPVPNPAPITPKVGFVKATIYDKATPCPPCTP